MTQMTIPSLSDLLEAPGFVAPGLEPFEVWPDSMSKEDVLQQLAVAYADENPLVARQLANEMVTFAVGYRDEPEIDRRIEIIRIERALAKPPTKPLDPKYVDLSQYDTQPLDPNRLTQGGKDITDGSFSIPGPSTEYRKKASKLDQEPKPAKKAKEAPKVDHWADHGQEAPAPVYKIPADWIHADLYREVEVVLTPEMTYVPCESAQEVLRRLAQCHHDDIAPPPRLRSDMIKFKTTPEQYEALGL